MKPIKLYFAGEWGPRKEQGDLEIRNRLVSFLYPKQLDKWLETSQLKGNVILDSGAFSAWNKGVHVDINEYVSYIKQAQIKCDEKNKRLYVVNLDVIPGRVGETKALNSMIGNTALLKKNADTIEKAAKKGFKNMLFLKKNNINPIHVFHQGEKIKWLDKMVEHTDYIGISPANDMPNDSKKRWIHSIFEYIYKKNYKVKTHGFAVMVPELLRDLPWTSCDAISWLMIAATGCVLYPIGGFSNPKITKYDKFYNQILVSGKKIPKGAVHMTDTLLKQFKKDGYCYDDLQDYKIREAINVSTYHLMQKWLNAYKKQTVYAPKVKFF